jgi:hypothetical protein
MTAEPRSPRSSRGVSPEPIPFHVQRTATGAGCEAHVSWSVCGASGTVGTTTMAVVVVTAGVVVDAVVGAVVDAVVDAVVTAGGSAMSGPLSLPSPDASPPPRSVAGAADVVAVGVVVGSCVTVVVDVLVADGRSTATVVATWVDGTVTATGRCPVVCENATNAPAAARATSGRATNEARLTVSLSASVGRCSAVGSRLAEKDAPSVGLGGDVERLGVEREPRT